MTTRHEVREREGENIAISKTIANTHVIITAPIHGVETTPRFQHVLPSRDADTIHVRYPTCVADISERKYLILDGEANIRLSDIAMQIVCPSHRIHMIWTIWLQDAGPLFNPLSMAHVERDGTVEHKIIVQSFYAAPIRISVP